MNDKQKMTIGEYFATAVEETIAVELNHSQSARLKSLCRDTGVTPKQLLEDFVADLTETDGNGGSDERFFAADWFDRRGYRHGRYL